jgi:hypothetical protein
MAEETPLKKIYFNMYLAGMIRQRQDCEAVNTDLLYFTLLMKMNQYAKEVYFTRKAKVSAADSKGVFDHLMLLREFTLKFYEVPTPNWKLIQNELQDPLEHLDSLQVEEDPWGDKKELASLVDPLIAASLEEKRRDDSGEQTPHHP